MAETTLEVKKLNLADLFYDFAFNNEESARINHFVETEGKDKPVPDRPDLREWAERMAAKFTVVKPGLLKRI